MSDLRLRQHLHMLLGFATKCILNLKGPWCLAYLRDML